MDFRIFLRSTTDWSMDNIWTFILDKLKEERPDLWDRFRNQVRANPTMTRATIAGIMQAVGWTKDLLSFLPANLQALGDDMLSQSAGSIANYFLRQPDPAVPPSASPSSQISRELRELAADLREYVRKIDFMNEQDFPSDSPDNLIARMRVIYELRNRPLTDDDQSMLAEFEGRINRVSARARKMIQSGLNMAEFDHQCLKYIDEGKLPESQRAHHAYQWEHRNMLSREYVRESVAMSIEEMDRTLCKASRMVEDGFRRLASG